MPPAGPVLAGLTATSARAVPGAAAAAAELEPEQAKPPKKEPKRAGGGLSLGKGATPAKAAAKRRVKQQVIKAEKRDLRARLAESQKAQS